jgi:hypothetical protein
MNRAMQVQVRTNYAVQGAMGLTANEGLNMARQFTDIGVTAAMGMNPLMIAIQQGPQLMDIFQQAAIRTGESVKAVMRGVGVAIWTAMAPLLPFIAAIGAAAALIGGTLTLATRSLNRGFGDLTEGMGLTADQLENVQNKGVTRGDVLGGTFNYLRDIIWDRIGHDLAPLGVVLSSRSAGARLDGLIQERGASRQLAGIDQLPDVVLARQDRRECRELAVLEALVAVADLRILRGRIGEAERVVEALRVEEAEVVGALDARVATKILLVGARSFSVLPDGLLLKGGILSEAALELLCPAVVVLSRLDQHLLGELIEIGRAHV